MAKKILIVFIAFIFSSCSKYYKFDELYDKGNYLQAYDLLEQVGKKDNPHYQRRLFRIVTKMALDGDADFIQKLRNIITNDHYKEVNHYIEFGDAYLHFLDAKNPPQYSAVISNLLDTRAVPEEYLVYCYKIRGIAQYKTGNYNLSISDLNESYKMDRDVDNLYFIGMSFYGLEDYKQAASYFNRVIAGTQDKFFRGQAYFQLGEMDYYEGNYATALNKYLNAVNSYCQSADYTYKIGKCLHKLKYRRISPKFSKISLRIQKDYANAWFFLNIY